MSWYTHLVKVDIIVKRYKETQLGGPEPSNGVSAHGQEDKSHVKLEGLSCSLGCEETVTHNLERTLLLILKELPSKQPYHNHNPQ